MAIPSRPAVIMAVSEHWAKKWKGMFHTLVKGWQDLCCPKDMDPQVLGWSMQIGPDCNKSARNAAELWGARYCWARQMSQQTKYYQNHCSGHTTLKSAGFSFCNFLWYLIHKKKKKRGTRIQWSLSVAATLINAQSKAYSVKKCSQIKGKATIF